MTIEIKTYDVTKNPEYAHQVMDILVEESNEVWRIGIDRDHVLKMLEDKDKVGIIIAIEGGELVGTYIFRLGSEWFNPKAISCHDLLVWVRPDRRKSSIFIRMLGHVEAFLKGRGIPRNKLSQSTGINPEKTAALYEKMGYHVNGFTSVKDI